MKFIVTKNRLQHTPAYFLKRAGYLEIYDKKTGKNSFVKPIHGDGYPRLHVYVEESDSEAIFNAHVDMKKPSYKGTPAHSAEYEGEVVEKETERLKNLMPGE